MRTGERHCGRCPFAHSLGDSNEFKSRVCNFSSTPLGRPERPTLISNRFAEQRGAYRAQGQHDQPAAEHANPSVEGDRREPVPALGAGGPAAPVRPAGAASRSRKVCRSLLVTSPVSHSRVSTHHSGPPVACSSLSCVENELARGCLDALRAVVEAVEASAKRRAKLVGSLLMARDSRLAKVRAWPDKRGRWQVL